MEEWQERTGLLLSEEALQKLADSHVAVLGIGGVGGYAVEALVRCGVGHLTLIDHDTVSVSNLNRQIIADRNSIGKYKTEVMKERALLINPEVKIDTWECFFLPEVREGFLPFSKYSYVVDAIDTVSAKIELAVRAQEEGFPLISSMGTGNKLDPTAFRVTDIYNTKVCPLAKVMRRELRARNVKGLKVVYSEEEPIRPVRESGDGRKRAVPGSVSFVPSVAGLILAGEVVKDLVEI